MFKISPINDKKYQAECAEQCGTTFKPDYFAYSMTDIDTGILMGFSQFEITQNGGYIADLKERVGYSDFEAMFILGRSTMNFIDLCGNKICRAAADSADTRLLKAIGFKLDNDGGYIVDMSGFFDGHCDGHPVDLNKKD